MRIGVLFGGDNAERDVSIASAARVVAALRSRGHSVRAVDTAAGMLSAEAEVKTFGRKVTREPPDRSVLASLHDQRTWLRLVDDLEQFEVVFIALHGVPAEDGHLQALFDLAGICYTGSGSLGSALAFHKAIAKQLLKGHQVDTPEWIAGSPTPGEVEHRLGFPVVVKPDAQGSTVGLSLVREGGHLPEAIRQAATFGEVIVERFVDGRELTVGVLGDRPLSVGEISIDPDTTFSYAQKYQQGAVRETFPADLSTDVTERARMSALAAHRALQLDGYSRADFRLDSDGGLWLIEVNSLPGLTETSLMPQSAGGVGIGYPELCEEICRLAMHRPAVSAGGRDQ
jgi:D-alanine-D-alanine ligase